VDTSLTGAFSKEQFEIGDLDAAHLASLDQGVDQNLPEKSQEPASAPGDQLSDELSKGEKGANAVHDSAHPDQPEIPKNPLHFASLLNRPMSAFFGKNGEGQNESIGEETEF
jgi:hypothetical protein